MAALVAAVWLLIERKDCGKETFIPHSTEFFAMAIFTATVVNIWILILPYSRFARENIGEARILESKSILSVIYWLHLAPFLLIDSDWDAINPVFGEKWPDTAGVSLMLFLFYIISFFGFLVAFCLGKHAKPDVQTKFVKWMWLVIRILT